MAMTNESPTTPRPVRNTPTSKPRRRRTVLASEQVEDETPVLAGVYIRVSTAREEMISPELQQRDVDAYLARMSAQTKRPWRAVVVEQDLDISGRSFAREGIQRLMELMRQGAITSILTLPLRPVRPQPGAGPGAPGGGRAARRSGRQRHRAD